MVSTVRSLSNHYDTLRIKPTATGDEISNAFATQIKTARIRPDISVAQLAQISVAYETLRDPVRRRAYDASIGVNQEPKVEPRPPVTPEPRVASFIAASLREPVVLRETERRPQPDPVPEQWPVPRSKAPAAAPREPAAPARAEMPPRPRVEMAFEPQQASGISIDRKQATIGAGVAGVAILALALTLAPKQAGAPELATATTPAQAVTVGLPPATSAPGQSALPVQVPAATAAAARATAQPDAGTAEPAGDLAATTSSDQAQPTQTADEGAVQSTPTDATTEQAAAQSPSADTPADPAPAATITAAKLPLPEATMARTIERIGYACGSIVSSSTVSPGVFKLVCSSGDTYQAAPVSGRYRFHRWGSH